MDLPTFEQEGPAIYIFSKEDFDDLDQFISLLNGEMRQSMIETFGIDTHEPFMVGHLGTDDEIEGSMTPIYLVNYDGEQHVFVSDFMDNATLVSHGGDGIELSFSTSAHYH